jgi:hypothetical protein
LNFISKAFNCVKGIKVFSEELTEIEENLILIEGNPIKPLDSLDNEFCSLFYALRYLSILRAEKQKIQFPRAMKSFSFLEAARVAKIS